MGVEVIINANALFIPLASKSVHTIVTSPPYYGLRDYGISSQLGLEVTPDLYIANLVQVFRECKRILRDDGTLWVNIGDSYAGNMSRASNNGRAGFGTTREGIFNRGGDGIKDKDLIGIPWMLAFALRADGWYLRQDIIWAKPNPMPESVKDRCTKSHEYIFLLSKSKKYYYDNEAINEPAADRPVDSWEKRKAGGAGSGTLEDGHNSSLAKGAGYSHTVGNGKTRNKRDVWTVDHKNLQPDGQQPNTMHLKRLEGEEYMSPVRNKRDVWTVTTKPYKGAHYATFNPELIKPCILAGAPEGGIVFDPFVGSGTTVATALQLGRQGIGLDLSMKYLRENAKDRIDSVRLPLLECAL